MPADSISGHHGTTDPEQLLQRIHTNLHNEVVKEVKKVAHLESNWSAQKLTKRVVRYIYNSATNKNLRLGAAGKRARRWLHAWLLRRLRGEEMVLRD